MPHSAMSDLCLHCVPIALFGISRLKLVKESRYNCDSGDWLVHLVEHQNGNPKVPNLSPGTAHLVTFGDQYKCTAVSWAY